MNAIVFYFLISHWIVLFVTMKINEETIMFLLFIEQSLNFFEFIFMIH